MNNEIETPKLCRTHVHRHGHLVSQICFKSCEKRFLKRDNFQKITDIKKFCNYAEKWEKKTHTFNTVKSHVSWESLNNTTEIWEHKNCKGTFFKTEYLAKQSDVPPTQKDEAEEASNMVGTTPQATKVFAHRKSARKKYAYSSSWKDKDLMKCIICDEEKHKKGVLYH